MTRKLTLKRDVLQELSSDELSGVVAGTTKETMYSCMTYISCYITDCLVDRTQLCLEG